MRKILLLLLTLFSAFMINAQQIDEEFTTVPDGWEWNSLSFVTGGYLEISKQSAGGYAITPLVNRPSSVTIKTNNSGNTNRSIQIYYGDDDDWTLLFAYVVVDKVETVSIPEEDLLQLDGQFRFKIVNTGSNPYRIDRFTVGGVALPSEAAEILSFSVPNQIGQETINSESGEISLNVSTGTNVISMVPQIMISAKAQINPLASQARDFSSPVQYVVTSENGTLKTWTVTVGFQDSDQNQIVDFKLSSQQIGNATIGTDGIISVKMPEGANLSNMIPQILTISGMATISPAANTPRNFNNDVVYTVTAQNGSEKTWTIKVSLVDPSVANIDFFTPVGFAAVSGDGFTGPTTGGGDYHTSTNIVTINGIGEFQKLVYLLYDRIRAYKNKANYGTAKYAPLIIVFEEGVYPETGSVANSGSVWGNSMLAVENQGDITFIGRGNVVLNFGINIKRSYNIIIRNITFQDYYDDGVNIGEPETHHVWVDHCTFGHPASMPISKDHPDGGVDVKNGASYVTVSWCKFRNSWKTGLVGHSDSNGATDRGRLKTTFFANYYYNTNSRHPRVRFGEVHVLNNLYEGVISYGIAASNEAQVVAEGNYFVNTVWPMYADRTTTNWTPVYGPWVSQTGYKQSTGLKQFNNLYDDSGLTRVYTSAQINVNMLNPGGKSIKFDELNPDAVFNPSTYYTYVPFETSLVPDLVRMYAGVNIVDFFGQTTSVKPGIIKPEPRGLKVYPNPTSGHFFVESADDGILTIADLSGKIVFRSSVEAGERSFNVSNIGLSKGIYMLTIQSNGNQSTTKLVVR